MLLTVPKRKRHATPQRVGEGAWRSTRVGQDTESENPGDKYDFSRKE